MLLKNKNAKHSNLKMNLPIVGEIQLKDGLVEVEKEIHDLMIGDGLNDWVTGEPTVETVLSQDEIETMVSSLSFAEVVSLAEEAKIKNYQLFTKNEKAMRTFVIKKLREAQEDAIIQERLKQLEIDGSDKTGSPLDEENV